jgi:hypothetical protein
MISEFFLSQDGGSAFHGAKIFCLKKLLFLLDKIFALFNNHSNSEVKSLTYITLGEIFLELFQMYPFRH